MKKKIGEFLLLFFIIIMLIGILTGMKGNSKVVIEKESEYEVDNSVNDDLFLNEGNNISRLNEKISIAISKGINGTLNGLYKIVKKIVA